MLGPISRAAVIAAVLTSAAPAVAQTAAYAQLRSEEAPAEGAALEAAIQDLCERKMVLLGENGFHGDGRTAAFKADLVQRLVDTCGFDAVVFESSRYDFIALQRAIRRGDAETPMLSSAIGGLWNQNEELQALTPFLFERATAGRVALGGLDDQLGSRGMFYSLEQMPAELGALAPQPRREDCARRLKQRIWSSYSAQDPYTEEARSGLRACLAEIDAALASADLDRQSRGEYRAMTAGFGRALDRDFLDGPQRIWARDHDMSLNLEAFMVDLPADAKVIVWSANGHVAKNASATELFATHPNFGQYVQRLYGAQAFALGFTAAGGAYRYTVRTPREIPTALPGSLEASVLADPAIEVVYLGPTALGGLGAMPASAFDDHKPVTTDWSEVYDGVVVFRAERPPHRLDE